MVIVRVCVWGGSWYRRRTPFAHESGSVLRLSGWEWGGSPATLIEGGEGRGIQTGHFKIDSTGNFLGGMVGGHGLQRR